MSLLLTALAILVLSGLAALGASRSPAWATRFGVGGVLAAAAIGMVPAIRVAFGGAAPESLHLAWDVPYGSFFVEIDALSAFFLVPILGVSALAALYGGAYLRSQRQQRPLGAAWFFFNLLVASMAVVVVARNGVLFLLAWELMSLASFFLVTFEDEKESVCAAGWTYLVAMHLGTAFLLLLFLLLAQRTGSLDFDVVAGAGGPSRACCSCWPWSASARRQASCRCTSGCPRPIRPHPATCPR